MNERRDVERPKWCERHVETDKPIWMEWWTVAQASATINLFFLISFYMISLTQLIWASFFAERQKKTKPRVDQFKKKRKESGKQCFNWWHMANPRGLWFPGTLQSSSTGVSSWLQVRAFCLRWLWCWCREASWTLGGSSLNCWDRPLAASPLSSVEADTCKNRESVKQWCEILHGKTSHLVRRVWRTYKRQCAWERLWFLWHTLNGGRISALNASLLNTRTGMHVYLGLRGNHSLNVQNHSIHFMDPRDKSIIVFSLVSSPRLVLLFVSESFNCCGCFIKTAQLVWTERACLEFHP